LAGNAGAGDMNLSGGARALNTGAGLPDERG
jgi:hypothetical protein